MDKGAKRSRGYVGCLVFFHLDESVTVETLKQAVEKFGTVLYANISDKTASRMAFVNMETKQQCAAVIAGLHKKPPFFWTVKLNEPPEVRELRKFAKEGRDDEVAPETQAKVAEYRQYEAEMNELIQKLSSSLQVSEDPGAGGDYRSMAAFPARTDQPPAAWGRPQQAPTVQQQTETGVIYEARLQGRALRPCVVCGTPTLGHCKRCKARYCSKKCQRDDWDMHSLDCRELEVPFLVTAGGDGPPAAPGRGQNSYRAPTDGYQSELEPAGGSSPRGRGAQRGRGGRGGAGRYSETDVEELSPGRTGGPRGRRPGRSPSRGSVAAAIRPLEAPAQPVISRLAGQPNGPPRHGTGLLKTPPGGPPASRVRSPPAGPANQLRSPPAAPVQPRTPPATAVQVKSPPAAGIPGLLGEAPAPTTVYAVTLEPGNTYQMVVSLVDGPGAVYLRLQEKLAETDQMEQQLQEAVAAGRGQPPPAVGQLCAGRFENAWYRGELLSCEGGQYRVRFIDWGNAECLPAGDLLPLPSRFASWPRQAVRARLDWRPAGGGGKWSDAQRAAAENMLQRMVVTRVTGRQGGEATVMLTDHEGRDMMVVPTTAAVTPAPAAPTPSPAVPVVPAEAPATPVVPIAVSAAPSAPAAPAGTSPSAPSPASAAKPAGAVSLAARLPDNLTPLLTGKPLELGSPGALVHPQELAMVLLDENYLDLDEELKNLPAQPTLSASAGDVVVAMENGSPSRALVCGTGANGYRLLFVDSGSVGLSKAPVRPLPARWSLDKFRPVALYIRLSESAPPGTRDALLREENSITIKLQRPAAGGGDEVVGHVSTVTGVSAAVTVSSCRALLGQLAGAAPDPAPAPAAPVAAGPASVQYVRLESGSQYVVLPCSMEHPQHVSAQLQDNAHYRPYLQMADRLKLTCAAACAPPLVPPVGSLLGLYCEAVGTPVAWRRAVLLESRGQQLRLRLVDWAVSVTARLADVRVLDSSFAQEKAIGVEFGLNGIAKDACPESALGFYRDRLINQQYLLDVNGEKGGVPQVTLNVLRDEKSYCFNEKMLTRLASVAAAAAAAASPTPAPAAPSPVPAHTAAAPAPAPSPTPAPAPSPTPAAAPAPAPSPIPAAAPAPAPAASPAPAAAATPAAATSAPPALFAHDLPKLDLKAGSKVPFIVTEVLSASNAYGMPLTDAAVEATTQLETLLPQLGERAPPLPQPQHDQLLLAPDADAGGWCRGVLLDLSDAGVGSVWLVDHGRLAEVPAAQLRLLHPDLARYPTGAVDITLAGYDGLNEAHATIAMKGLQEAAEAPLELEIVAPLEDGFSVRAPTIDAQLRAAGATV